MDEYLESFYLTPEQFSVLISGIASMGLEMLAGRMVAPEFGSSVYTWGSIIGVFMAALAIGYHYGGRRAKKKASMTSLSNLMILSSLYIAFIMISGDFMIRLGSSLPIGARYISVIPVTLLFGPPVFLLGFISPYAAQLSSKKEKGEASGNVYAIGTFGSIIGTFATTFVLLPNISVPVIQMIFAAFLVLSAIYCSRKSGGLGGQIGFAAITVVMLFAAFLIQNTGAAGAVHHTQTPYQKLEIRDSGGIRTMYLNGQPQSAMYLNGSDQHVFSYTRYFHLPFLMAENKQEIDRVLFIGGGGFSGPKRFVKDYDVAVDAVEIDPEVVRSAKRYFYVNESEELRIHVQDGRKFLQNTNRTYDLIIVDAYRKSSVPFHLTTREFMELTSSKLDRNGFLYANIISTQSGPGSKLYRSEYKTASKVYPDIYSFRTSSLPVTQNIEMIASKKELSLSESELQNRNRMRDIGINLSSEISNKLSEPKTGNVPLLTDDRAPVDRLLDPLVGTEYVVE